MKPGQVPILITAFNRPDKFKLLIDSLIGLENPIFVWFDGPRPGLRDNAQINISVNYLRSSRLNILQVIRNPENMGTNSVAIGISWILSQFDSAIILEEDVLVSRAFISFAEEMLEMYEDDFRIGSITSMNLVPESHISRPKELYRFSGYFYAWGWATWASRWNRMPDGTSHWDYSEINWPRTARNRFSRSRWLVGMNAVRDGSAPGLWDYRWIYCYWVNRWLTVVPNSNLGINIGFDRDATHTFRKPVWLPEEISTNWASLGIQNKVKISQDVKADKWAAKNVHSSSLLVVLKTKIMNILNLTILSR